MHKIFVQPVSAFCISVLSFITFITIFASLIVSTSSVLANQDDTTKHEYRLHVIATTFPIYLFTRNIIANRNYVKVDLLITSQSGCPHDYSPGPSDMARLTNADVVIKYGMGMDANIDKVLKNVAPKAKLVDASQGIMPFRHTDSEPAHADSHIHASPELAARMVGNIAKKLASIDPEGASAYLQAAEKYTAKLLSAGRLLNGCGRHLPQKSVILQQGSLTHLATAAGLEVIAIIEEDEGKTPSPSKLMEIAKIAKEGKALLIVCEAKLSDKLSSTIAKESGLPIVRLDSLSFGPVDATNSFYETVMARNCQILGQHLGIK